MCLNHSIAAFDSQKADGFADRLLDALNDGALCIMLSIGHRTGLFDQLDGQPPMTSETLATRAGLSERYVREWLNALVVSGVVTYEPGAQTYQLPAEHAAWLTRRSSDGNIAVFAQYIGVMGSVEDGIVDCFSNGGGLSYDAFPRFHEVMAEDSGQTVVSSLEDHILPLVPGLVDRLQQGIRVLDLGCGRGHALNRMARLYPHSRFTGFDLSEEAIAFARREAEAQGLDNVTFEARDLVDFHHHDLAGAFDLITTFDAVHDQARPLNLLTGIYRALKDDGVYLMQDIHAHSEVHRNMDHPVAPLLYAVSTTHCMTVSLAQGGEGLGTMWGREKAQQLLAEAGFSRVDIHQLEHDFQNDYYVVRR